MHDVLIEDPLDGVDRAELDRRIGAAPDLDLMEEQDQAIRDANASYALFERWPDLLPGGGALTDSQLACNRYFWLVRIGTLWVERHGGDPGFDQQAFQVLEELHDGLGVDVEVIEQIDQLARAV